MSFIYPLGRQVRHPYTLADWLEDTFLLKIGFVAAFWLGPRAQRDRESFYPNNMIMMLVGAGILWTCWNGFNGGDPYAASPDAGVAVLNTNICTAMSLLIWTILDYIFFGKPSVVGAVQGEITGLVAITPAAGFVAGWGAIVIGACSGSIPWISMNVLGRHPWFKKVDDVSKFLPFCAPYWQDPAT